LKIRYIFEKSLPDIYIFEKSLPDIYIFEKSLPDIFLPFLKKFGF
jgi:hypothetical protein